MATPFTARVGTTVGLITLLEFIPEGRAGRFRCRCVCGVERTIPATYVNELSKKTPKYCRCKEANHGESQTRLYHVYRGMIGRCTNPDHSAFERYGERGITVCERWQGRDGFLRFKEDMGPPPTDDHTVERRDNAGNYCPENCLWATSAEQANNRRTNVILEAFGRRQTMRQWAEELGVDYQALRGRIRNGWDHERALSVPFNTAEARAASPSSGRKRFSDRVGETIGRLTILEYLPGTRDKKPPARFRCRCSCGTEHTVTASGLTSGQVSSCGCYASERMAAMNRASVGSPEGLVITFDGQTHSLQAWADIVGLPYHTLYSRFKKGLPAADVLRKGT